MNTDKLKELALAATPGNWFKWSDGVYAVDPEEKTSLTFRERKAEVCEIFFNREDENGRENQAYIAAANPATILALIAQRDELLALVNQLLEMSCVASKEMTTVRGNFIDWADNALEIIAKAVQP